MMAESTLLVSVATAAGRFDLPNEDWAATAGHIAVVLDGATARLETGCRHGVAWYTQQLGTALIRAALDSGRDLKSALADAIEVVARIHPECDLTHPGTPSAGVGIVRLMGDDLAYLVLGDVSLVIETQSYLHVITDDRVSQTAHEARRESDRHPIGSPEKAEALLTMKAGELSARNREGGYWIAAAESAAAHHALTGAVRTADVRRIAMASDGAARAVAFGLIDWKRAIDISVTNGPSEIIRLVRQAEAQDPEGARWPRNKASDDATFAILQVTEGPQIAHEPRTRSAT